MGSLLSAPEPTPEDPTAKAMRDREQQRAEDERIRSTQDQLTQETQLRSKAYGTRSLLGSLLGKRSLLGTG